MIHADPKQPLMFPSKDLLCGGRRRRPACGHHALRIHARNREGAVLDRCLCRERCVTLTDRWTGIIKWHPGSEKICLQDCRNPAWPTVVYKGGFFWRIRTHLWDHRIGIMIRGWDQWVTSAQRTDGQAVSPRKTVQPEQGSNTKRRQVKWSLKIKSFPADSFGGKCRTSIRYGEKRG